MTTHFSTLARKISWTDEPGGLQSVGSQRVGHDWATNTYPLTSILWACRGGWGWMCACIPGEVCAGGSRQVDACHYFNPSCIIIAWQPKLHPTLSPNAFANPKVIQSHPPPCLPGATSLAVITGFDEDKACLGLSIEQDIISLATKVSFSPEPKVSGPWEWWISFCLDAGACLANIK